MLLQDDQANFLFSTRTCTHSNQLNLMPTLTQTSTSRNYFPFLPNYLTMSLWIGSPVHAQLLYCDEFLEGNAFEAHFDAPPMSSLNEHTYPDCWRVMLSPNPAFKTIQAEMTSLTVFNFKNSRGQLLPISFQSYASNVNISKVVAMLTYNSYYPKSSWEPALRHWPRFQGTSSFFNTLN